MAPTATTSPATTSTSSKHELTASDRCDYCGAQAYFRVTLKEGVLDFCKHHMDANFKKLEQVALTIHDESHKLK